VTRRMATVLGVGLAVVCVVELVALTGLLAAERRADRTRYDQALAAQRHAAGAPLPLPADEAPDPRDTIACVAGVDTPVRAAQRALGVALVTGDRLDVEALRALSGAAFRGQRYLEQSRGAPALPQRMGRQRVDPDRPGPVVWEALAPEAQGCGAGEAFGSFPVSGGAK
jgi:hypothetical protein